MEKRLMTFIACLFLSVGMALAQTQVSGTVTSSEDGEPVVGASVRVVGTKTGAVTDINGKFNLTLSGKGKHLKVSYVGMKEKTVAVNGNTVNIVLDPDHEILDEVIVVAFGTAKKSAFTGSATEINAEDLEKSQVTSITNALSGVVPGVQLTSSDGDPASTSTIRIRGFSSLNAGNDPLIIVDGAPYSGDLVNINPSDVESMTVLKDAASNALYGARGANGVIMITTKKAKVGDAKVTLDAKWGWNTRALQHYDVITNPAEYYEAHYTSLNNYYLAQGYSSTEAWQLANSVLTGAKENGGLGYNVFTYPEGEMMIGQNGKINPNATLGRIVNYNGEDYLVTPDDWEDIATRTGSRQEYNLSISAANEKSTFFASLGYLDTEGITYGSDLERLTGRLRADYQAKKWLKVGANLSFAHYDANSLKDNGTSASTYNVWAFTTQIAPIYPIYARNADGSIKVDGNGIQIMDYGSGQVAGLVRPFITDANPAQNNLLDTDGYEGNSASANGYIDIEFFPGLKLTLNGTYNLDETRYTTVYNPYYGQFDTSGGTVAKEHYRLYDYNLQQILNYTTTIADKHNLGVMLGHEYYNIWTYNLSATKSNMFSQSNKELNGAVIDSQSSSSSKTQYNNEGYFGRLLYDYEGKYFFSGSLRRDASSRFSKNHRWGTFWSVGAAWLLTKESFMKNASWVDELKLKVSYGSQGNDNISSYRYTDTYSISNSNDQIGISFYSKGTEDITWETNKNFNIGTEFRLFKKLSGSLEFYHRKTTDMLYSFSVAPSLGYSSYYDNVGDLYNQGFELTLNYNAFNTKNFNWDIHFNIASLKNRLTKLHDDKKTATYYDSDGKAYRGYASNNFFIAEDVSMYTWRMKEYAGVDPTTGESMWYKNTYQTDEAGNQVLDDNGNAIWTGRTTTTTYSDADYYITNKTTVPKFYGGFGTSVYAYGFDFSINLTFQLGGYGYDGTYARFMGSTTSNSTGYNIHKDIYNSWSATNTSSNVPRFQYGDLYTNAMSTRFLTSSSYLNIDNINVGYTLPAAWTKKAYIEKLRIYAACENVAYFSKRKGYDPRQTYTETTNSTYYSPMRTFSIGVNLQF